MYERGELILITALILSLILLNIFKVSVYIQILVYLTLLLPYIFKKLKEYLEEEEMENNFPIFLRDLAQYLEIGQPLPVALKSIKENNYGKRLNYEIRKMLSEMEFGLTFIEAFERVAKRTKSEKIKKTIYSIIEAERYGGDIKGLLENLSRSLEELIEIKKERISKLKNFMLVYYGIFISFLISIVLIIYFIKRFFGEFTTPELLKQFKTVTYVLIFLNAVFTGLVIGKVSTGKAISGITHSIILVVLSSLVMYLI
ncbi:MAG TPA: hypothetical protein EYH22_02355 [Candidatus Nanopusillus sp.]|nr:hypothetical protein [Candidatus Nanopusillus sp.]